jgi:hypothetical protein
MPLGQQMPRVARYNTPLAVYAEQDAQREMTQLVTTTGNDCSLTVIPLGSLALPRISIGAFVGPGFEIEVADPFTIAIRQCAVAIIV